MELLRYSRTLRAVRLMIMQTSSEPSKVDGFMNHNVLFQCGRFVSTIGRLCSSVYRNYFRAYNSILSNFHFNCA